MALSPAPAAATPSPSELRSSAQTVGPVVTALLLGACVVLDAAMRLPLPVAILLGLLLLAGFGHAMHLRATAMGSSRRLDLQVSAFAVVGAYALVERLDGSLAGRSFPLVYLCMIAVTALTRPAAALGAVGIALGLEVAVQVAGSAPIALDELGRHMGFMILFAATNAVGLGKEHTRATKESQAQLAAEVTRLRDEARRFRLTSTPAREGSKPRAHDEDERLVRSGVEEIHLSVLFALKLLRSSLGLRTAILLWIDEGSAQLRISEASSDEPKLLEGPFSQGDGILGAAISGRRSVQVTGLKPSYKLPYYPGACPVRAVYALPVFEGATLRGVLVVDRAEDRLFSSSEAELIEEAGLYALRAVRNEQVFMQLERARSEQGKLYRAAESLGAATTEMDVVNAGLRSAREITSVDFAAVTIWDEVGGAHEVRAVSGDPSGELQGYRFRKNAGLVSMVVENRHALPYRGEYDESQQVVFSKRLRPPAMPSLVVLPLLVHERPLGTLVLGSQRRGAFGEATRGTLEVLASHMAVSLSNARMLRRLEELATTDGLTGLLNKRALLEMAEQKLAAARRFDRQLSVLVTDIDHFKKVNDTYGHDVGDVIIKGLGDVLRRNKRSTDSVARFGGEEFVVICEETDARGAMLLAERVREELQRTGFHAGTDKEGRLRTVQVTCSMGVATFPSAGATWEELFKAADEALYASKRGGRNRSTAAVVPSAFSRAPSSTRRGSELLP